MAIITGLPKVLDNLQKEIKKIEKGSLKGLIRSTVLIRRDMDKKFPLIPVDTGNLRSSWFTITSNGSRPDGKSPKFIGKDAGIMSSDHTEVVNESYNLVRGKEPGIAFGFTANYAWPIHEMVGVNYQRPGAGGKFLQGAINRNKKEILKIIAEEAKIK